MKNRSFLYLLPLIEGWSAAADCPNNCYAKCSIPGILVVEYTKSATPHNRGISTGSGKKVVYVSYVIMSEYIDDYKLIMNGKYSKISEEAKQLILRRTDLMTDYEHVESVMYKTKSLRKYLENKLNLPNLDELTDEYESIFDDCEIFKLEEVYEEN